MDLAPVVVASVPKWVINTRTVEQALTNLQWVRDIRGGLTATGLIEYLELWNALLNFYLSDMDDRHLWRHDSSGCFSSKLVYRLFFHGSISFEPGRRL
ncbi:hypothetical protein PR202_ga20287 [Eleusine coracana subsp. coracana]|uniref:Uncharacterized protein n=1 Tax=Eleusine coracana subsp. coracana TaxID=191504 RepID=A0AAV5CXN2_ELECO|nr:hypothetical protein PR202_ga20287 [Eleusine coracana subsp. coracana]